MATESMSESLANELVEMKLLKALTEYVDPDADKKSALKKAKKKDTDKA
jgi:hypothetical protein